MRYQKFEIPTPNPWRFPSQYPYFLLEGSGRLLSEDEKQQIKAKREAWRPSKIAINLNKILNNCLGKTVLLQVENPQNYYDSLEDLPKPFTAELRGVIVERVLDADMEFDQLFILLSNPRHINGASIFMEKNYDYQTLLKPQDNKNYKLNFSVVTKLAVEQVSIWKQLFKSKNGS